jgi:hypothetical protein
MTPWSVNAPIADAHAMFRISGKRMFGGVGSVCIGGGDSGLGWDKKIRQMTEARGFWLPENGVISSWMPRQKRQST